MLENNTGLDFGMHIIPEQLQKGNTYSYIFDDYWEDIGTIKSYYNANIKLIENTYNLNIFNKKNMLLTHASSLPPPQINNTLIEKSIITDGCFINALKISHSLIGLNTSIKEGSTLLGVLSLGSLTNMQTTSIGKKLPPRKSHHR